MTWKLGTWPRSWTARNGRRIHVLKDRWKKREKSFTIHQQYCTERPSMATYSAQRPGLDPPCTLDHLNFCSPGESIFCSGRSAITGSSDRRGIPPLI